MAAKPELPVVVAIDDDALQLRMITSILSNRFIVLTATKASHGINLLETFQKSDGLDSVHAILIDIMMPHVNGLLVLKMIREKFGPIPVIMCSAVNRKEYVVKAIKMGANDYILKPYRSNILLDRLTRVRQRIIEAENAEEEESAPGVDESAADETAETAVAEAALPSPDAQ